MIIKIRKTFGVYLSPSTIYTLLRTLEKKGFVKSDWIICERPRRVYNLTVDGQNMLKFTEDSLTFIFKMSKFGKLVEGLNGQDGNGVSKPIKEDYSS
jgi:DNA-binding PadR family transcriptional regulator